MDNLPLDFFGVLYGTDKSSMSLDYLRHYGHALSTFRSRTFNLLEIGVFDGASVKMWRSFFPKAQIVGVDILERCRIYQDDRIAIEIGSQTDCEFLTTVAQKYPPLVIIDDGSHQADHIISSFECLFSAVLPGGCYIVEDLHMHGGERSNLKRGGAPMGAQNYVLTYARQLLDGQIDPLHVGRIGVTFHHQIDRIESFRGAAIIWKKERHIEQPDYSLLELLAARSGLAKAQWLLASFTLRNGGPMDLAQRAAARAVEMVPAELSYRDMLAAVLAKAGDTAGAIRALQEAVAVAPASQRDALAVKIGKLERTI